MRSVEELGIAWLSSDGGELGSIGGGRDLDAAIREAAVGLVKIFPTADRAVVYEGRSLTEGRVVQEIHRRDSGPNPPA
jgi:hypothetical protein